jgi:hypothetical protein
MCVIYCRCGGARQPLCGCGSELYPDCACISDPAYGVEGELARYREAYEILKNAIQVGTGLGEALRNAEDIVKVPPPLRYDSPTPPSSPMYEG